MCGIAGWIDFNADLRERTEILKRMSATLERRGPDEGGAYIERNAALLHRRLTVIDPENGKQPMTLRGPRGSFTLVYNGELYNTEELRRALVAAGRSFHGHSDTEVLLASYLEWGEDCLTRLNGIYAFAVWEQEKQRLFLARDRMGVKPLFLYPCQDGLLFGSEVKTLLANPLVRPRIDNDGLAELFLLGPGRTSGNGVFQRVRELKAGECAVFDADGLRVRTYWMLHAAEHTDTPAQTIEHTRALITDAVRGQLVSDVPLCTFLSGGLDSSIISAIAAEQYRARGEHLTTYSVDYADNARYFQKNLFQPDSDNAYIERMTRAIGSEHRQIVLDNTDLADALTEAADARDLPGMADVDSSLLLFCREVKRNFTVAVSGECADEIFGGYPWYHNKELLFEDAFPWSRSLDLRQSLLRGGLLPHGREYVDARYRATCNAAEKLTGESPLDARMREMFRLNLDWFMQTLLDRKDRMSMYCGLEVRVPFCDHRIVEYAYNMPWELKSWQGREKGIVREAVRGMLPEEVLWRKKSPYPKTCNPIYTREVCRRAQRLLDEASPVAELLDRAAVQRLIDHPDSLDTPWYGQLMRGPQILAYLIQMDCWWRKFSVELV